METTVKPKRKPGLNIEEMDGELILFSPRTTKVLYFNPTASVIWQLCDGEHTLGEIVDLLAAAYPDAAEKMLAQVEGTLQVFLENETIKLI
jgi:hypothetical protein